MLWVCRILTFVWTFMYHDWQSLVTLFWLLHSTQFNSTTRFIKMTAYFYLPLIMVSMLFYYTINIYGIMFLVYEKVFMSNPSENYKYVSYGLIKLNYPPL
jgi:hypothetical protein